MIWTYLVGVASAIAVGFTIWLSGKSSGKAEAKQKDIKDALNSIRGANETREEVNRMDDDSQLAEFDRLRAARRKKDSR